MNHSPIIRCAIYTRKSSEEGLEQAFNSLDAQREACEAYIASQKAEGWTALPEFYDDGGYSGGTLGRPALQTLLSEIEAGRVDVVVVYKIDRLSRSLMDFAKLIEVFDRKAVTFVSVTQSFNTTTSMGRLTLNVLLSFAQFEREVTGERIRDKFAASKKKGMWMGGNIPLGYDLEARKLVVNAGEAETVRLIFRKYLELGCVRSLRDDLKQKAVCSKIWVSSTGVTHGGQPFERGGLYCLLRNRLYIGKTLHKGTIYQGEHEAIVPTDLFEAVQQRLTTTRRRQLGKTGQPQGAPLAQMLVDSVGSPMTPTYSVKPGGRRYRYYVSQPALKGSRAAIARVPAPPLEQLIDRALQRLRLPCLVDARPVLRQVQIRSSAIVLTLDRTIAMGIWRQPGAQTLDDPSLLALCRNLLEPGETIDEGGDALHFDLPIRARFRGGRTTSSDVHQHQGVTAPDPALLKALARGHRWKAMLLSGEMRSVDALATHVKQERRHVGRTLSLAFLSPSITLQILKGEHPAGLRLSALLDVNIPLSWHEQHHLFAGFAYGKA